MIRKYLFMALTATADASGKRREIVASVEAMTKDGAVSRLVREFPFTNVSDWDFIQELDPEHFVGAMGYDFKYLEERRLNG